MLSLYLSDLSKLTEEVIRLAPVWRRFGLALGIHMDILKTIERNNNSVEDCLPETLDYWLRNWSKHTPESPPSWEQVVRATAKEAGGNNRALAQQIAQQHNGRRQNNCVVELP